jgi:hypothetical protein
MNDRIFFYCEHYVTSVNPRVNEPDQQGPEPMLFSVVLVPMMVHKASNSSFARLGEERQQA